MGTTACLLIVQLSLSKIVNSVDTCSLPSVQSSVGWHWWWGGLFAETSPSQALPALTERTDQNSGLDVGCGMCHPPVQVLVHRLYKWPICHLGLIFFVWSPIKKRKTDLKSLSDNPKSRRVSKKIFKSFFNKKTKKRFFSRFCLCLCPNFLDF